ncbi:MAG: MBOAT family protein [Prevotellaceae bacterium]|nr:MBOAT family protein [Prevotellaceae bacterium]
MIFTSVQFWAAFIAFLTLFALLRQAGRKLLMLYVIAASLAFFYASNHWLMLLLPATALVSWGLTRRMSHLTGGKRRALLFLVIVLDLLPLLFFKYAQPLSDLLRHMLATNFSLKSIVLPIGISFYTFQAISYSVDVYRRDFRLSVTFLEYLFYLSFFPLLLAGPITRASTFFPQIRRNAVVSERLLYRGLWLVILGIVKKAVIADYIAQYNDWIFSMPEAYSGFECLMGLFGFSMQIYLDFSGYSDISIGIAAMLGIRLRENFVFPYRSHNLTEFWHRWHISLSTWFRDYLYIPLGGNRHGILCTCLCLFATMLAAGIWHGSTTMFLVWSALHGLGLILHKLLRPILRDIRDNTLTISISRFITLCFVIFCWTFFRSPDPGTAHRLLAAIFTRMDLSYAMPFFEARTTWCILLFSSLLSLAIGEKTYCRIEAKFIRWPWTMKLLAFMFVVQLAIELNKSNIQPFLYFSF